MRITINDMPEELVNKLNESSKRNYRSREKEVIYRLNKSFNNQKNAN